MAEFAVRHTQELFAPVAVRAASGASVSAIQAAPGASVLIRRTADAATADVYTDRTKGTAVANPVPTGVPEGSIGLSIFGNLNVFLDPDELYETMITVGGTTTGPFPMASMPRDPAEPIAAAAVEEALAAFGGVVTEDDLAAATDALTTALDGKATPAQIDAAIAALSGTYVEMEHIERYGGVGDGVTDDFGPVSDAITAQTSGAPVYVTAKTFSLGSPLNRMESVVLRGIPGAVLLKNHTGSRILQVTPTGVAGGTVDAITAGNVTVTVAGAGWTVNEHAGKWACIAASPTASSTRVISNTADTITLEHPVGKDISGGAALTFYIPIPLLDLRDIAFDGNNQLGGNTAIVTEYVDEVIIHRVACRNSTVNSLSINHASKVRVIDCDSSGSASFGIIVYNSDDVRVIRPRVRGWGTQFAVQLKDCRNARVVDADCDAASSAGSHAISLKCSGLHAAYDMKAVRCNGRNAQAVGMEISSIATEGTYFALRDTWLDRCHVKGAIGAGYAEVYASATQSVVNVGHVDCYAELCGQAGAVANIPSMQIQGFSAYRCGQEGVLVNADDVHIKGGELVDNCQNGPATYFSEIKVGAAADRTVIESVGFRRSAVGKANRAVRELAGATKTQVRDCRITDPTGSYVTDYTFSGGGSHAIGAKSVDNFGAGSPVVNKTNTAALSGSKSYNPASVADGATTSTTVTVAGAVPGDVATATHSALTIAGIVLYAQVTDVNTVTVTLVNHSGGAFDLGNGTLLVRVQPA